MGAGAEAISTPVDFLRAAARRWLAIPGVERLVKFYRICDRIVHSDDQWVKSHWERIHALRDSPGVKIFLMEKGEVWWPLLAIEAADAKSATVRRAAGKALDKWRKSDEGSRELAEQIDLWEWMASNRDKIEALSGILPNQPQVITSTQQVDALVTWARLGLYGEIDDALEGRWAYIKRWWKQRLGVAAHRMATSKQRVMARQASLLKAYGRSWSAIARAVDPMGFQENPKRTIDKIKKGVKSLLKQSARSRSSQAEKLPS